MPERCTALKRDGTPCRRWATPGTDPPRCALHPIEGAAARVGAPPGNQNATKHGVYSEKPVTTVTPVTLESVIDDLGKKLARLSQYIENNRHDLDPADLVTLLNLHGQLSSRYGRLKRDQQKLQDDGAATGDHRQAIRDSLAIVGELLGVDLT
jgi:hypothetical protein